MQPTVGRVVHYVSHGTPGGEPPKACRAAIVTQTFPTGEGLGDVAGLAVLNPTGMFFHPAVHESTAIADNVGDAPTGLCGGDDYPGGTWHWPTRVEN